MSSAARSLPLSGRRVVVTRAAEDARALGRRLAALGAVPILCPVIEIGPPPDAGRFDDALRRASSAHWIVFTSPSGVRAAFARAAALGLDAGCWGARLAAIGTATADALRAFGAAPAFVPATFVAEALGDELPDVAGRRVLLLRAEDGRRVLRERLARRGAHVEDVAAYTTRPAPVPEATRAALDAGVDAVTFTSASTVRHFMGLPRVRTADLLARAIVASIGPVTTAAARALGVRVDVEARTATMEGLADALARHFAPVHA